MDEKIIKSGWVLKRSVYLKQWRKRWLVLSENSVSTFKTKDTSSMPTMLLPISEITEAVPTMLEKDFSFKITCSQEYFMTVESDKELCLWLNLINHVRIGRNVFLFDAPHFSRESKAMTDETLITSFTQIKSILNQREEELLNSLKDLYQNYQSKAEEEHLNSSETLSKEIENCKIIAESLSSEASVLHKIQQIQRLTKEKSSFAVFDGINESSLKISMEQDMIQKITRPNIKVALKSPAEWAVRRTLITRALKWRYTGNRIDALTFSANHDLELVGVGICAPYKNGGVVNIKEFQVLKGQSSNSPVIYRHNGVVTIKYNPDESVFKVPIHEGVMVKADSKYTVSFVIEGSHTYKCVDCFSQIDGHVTWNFFSTNFAQNHQTNRCDATCGPIADFHYILN